MRPLGEPARQRVEFGRGPGRPGRPHELPAQTARYIRIVCVAASGFWWSIAEINVYGSSSSTGSIAAPTAVPKGLQLKTWTSPEGAQVTAVFNGTAGSRNFPVSADGSYTYTLPSGTSAMFTTQKLAGFPAPVFGSLKPKLRAVAT